MASLPNLVPIVCVKGPTPQTTITVYNSLSVFRGPQPFPLNLAGAGTTPDPVGPQRWPLKL